MKHLLPLPLILAACAPVPICDRDAITFDKYGNVVLPECASPATVFSAWEPDDDDGKTVATRQRGGVVGTPADDTPDHGPDPVDDPHRPEPNDGLDQHPPSEPPALGNPGNNKPVGRAGESPNGRDFGNGQKGRSE